MAGPNFELITELIPLNRRDFAVADPDILKPLSTTPLLDGEWLNLTSDQKLERGADGTHSMAVYPVHTERGRYDTQAIAKTNVLFLGQFEAKTKMYKTTDNYTIGAPLMVVTVSGRRVLGLSDRANGTVEVGYVAKLPANGELRFVRTPPTMVKA